MIVALGHFLTRIVWERDAVLFNVPKWRKNGYLKQLSDDCVELRVKEGNPFVAEYPIDGWNAVYQDYWVQATYTHAKNPLFSLTYATNRDEVTVIARKNEDTFAKLGIQYGLLVALYRYCIGLHGVTILCGNEIVILSAPSGTGKTTLANMLEEYYGAVVLNGDFAMLSVSNEGVIFEPTPFCGSSGRCLNHRVMVNRVVFLEQSKNNQWRDMTGREAIIRFMSNTFIPIWDKDRRQTIQENIIRCVSMIDVNSFSFAPTQEAARVFVNQLRVYEE